MSAIALSGSSTSVADPHRDLGVPADPVDLGHLADGDVVDHHHRARDDVEDVGELGGDLVGVVLVDRRPGQRQVVGAVELAAGEQQRGGRPRRRRQARRRRRLHRGHPRSAWRGRRRRRHWRTGSGTVRESGSMSDSSSRAVCARSARGVCPTTGSSSCSKSWQARSLLGVGHVGLLHDRAEQAVRVAEGALEADPGADRAGLVVERDRQVAQRERADLEGRVEAVPLGVDGASRPG